MRLLIKLTALLGLACAAPAATIQFEQEGWSSGAGPLRVSFAGQDSDANGSLIVEELVYFAANWNTAAGEQTAWYLTDIEPDGFVFTDLGNYLFFVRNTHYSLVSSAFEGEALSSVFDNLLFPVDSSSAPATGVPEPGTLWIVAAGSLATLARRRRRL
jgi:hypothetical protein